MGGRLVGVWRGKAVAITEQHCEPFAEPRFDVVKCPGLSVLLRSNEPLKRFLPHGIRESLKQSRCALPFRVHREQSTVRGPVALRSSRWLGVGSFSGCGWPRFRERMAYIVASSHQRCQSIRSPNLCPIFCLDFYNSPRSVNAPPIHVTPSLLFIILTI